MTNQYHHGNLKQALIDAGVKIINKEGEQGLSLRKVASACDVSHSAPYAHFKDKDELLDAIKISVTEQFTNYLRDAVDKVKEKSAEEKILVLGKSYIKFFSENPDYFKFLFYNQNITVHLSQSLDNKNDYSPYLMLKSLFEAYLIEKHIEMTNDQKEIELIKIWSSVQGLASLASMENVFVSKPWDELIDKLLH